MRSASTIQSSRLAGFTLIELVMVIVVLSVISAGLVRVLGGMTGGILLQKDSQISQQLVQECAEYLLGLRRHVGYNMNSVSNCSSLPTFSGSVAVATITNPSADTACPALASCKRFDITATHASSQAKSSILMVSY